MFPAVRYLEVLRPLNFLVTENDEYESIKRKVLDTGRPISDFLKESVLSVQDMASAFTILACEHQFHKIVCFLNSVEEVHQFCEILKATCDFIDIYEVHYRVEPNKRQ